MRFPYRLVGALLLLATTTATTPCPAPEPTSPEHLGAEAAAAVRHLFDYDARIPLEARIVEKSDEDGAMREKIVFRGAQGFLVPGYLQIPAAPSSARPCVLLLHGWSGSKESWYQDGGYISGGNMRQALLRAGYAVLALDAQCHGDRIAQNDFAPVNHYIDPDQKQPRRGYFTQREIYVQTVIDYRRAIDYVATRSEIDHHRLAVAGYSMGATQGVLLLAVEPRVQAAVLCALPADPSKWSLIAPQNYLHHIGNRPVLMCMGRGDSMCSEAQARGLFGLLDSQAHQLLFFDSGHKLPTDYVKPAVAWIKKHVKTRD